MQTNPRNRVRQALGLTAILFGLAPALAPRRAEALPEAYTLYCRGGHGRTDLVILDGSKKGNSYAFKKHVLHGDEAFGTGELAPAACVWADRGMRVAEPRQLMFVGQWLGGVHISSSEFTMGKGLSKDGSWWARVMPGNMSQLNHLQDPNYVVEFKAYRQESSWAVEGPTKSVSVLRISGIVRSFQVDAQSNRG